MGFGELQQMLEPYAYLVEVSPTGYLGSVTHIKLRMQIKPGSLAHQDRSLIRQDIFLQSECAIERITEKFTINNLEFEIRQDRYTEGLLSVEVGGD